MNVRWIAALPAVAAALITVAGSTDVHASSSNPDRDPCEQDPGWWDGTCDDDIQPGPAGVREAIGRDRDLDVAYAEARAEADDVCFSNWSMVGHPEVTQLPRGAWRYTLTYTC